MPYLGKAPNFGVRQRYIFTQSGAGATSISGSDDSGATLKFSDGNFVDVYLNGVLLVSGTDYNTNTANTISGLSALASADVIEIVVYDIFAVADTVKSSTGGAFNGGVTIDGNLGVGTTAPAVNLEVEATTTNGLVRIGQLQFKNSSGSHISGTDGVHIFPFSDGNIFHDNYDGGFVWRYGTSSTEAMRINDSGRVKIGTSSTVSNVNLEVLAVDAGTAGGHGGVFASDTAGGYACIYCKSGTNVSNLIIFYRTTSIIGSITTNGSATSYNTTSDYRLKENVTGITEATDRLKQLNPVRFNFISDPDSSLDGFLAHEVETVVPEAVVGTKDATEKYEDEDGKEQTRIVPQGIDQSKLVPLLVKTIQELEARITALESK